MTYHHVPGHPVADIYAHADPAWRIEAVDFWQDEAFFHPLTCGRKSSHSLLRAVERDGRAVMVCPTCGYHQQDWIPDAVLRAYGRRKEIIALRRSLPGARNYREESVEEAYADSHGDAEDVWT